MSAEVYLIYLLALAAFFATPPDTSQLLIISNALRHGDMEDEPCPVCGAKGCAGGCCV